MKKFFTLFAMLSLALSASADYFNPDVSGNYCVFYESGMQDVNFNKVYAYNSQGRVTGVWPGDDLVQEGTYNGKTLYKATFTSEPEYVIFSGNGKQTVDLGFTNKGYYYVDKKEGNNYSVSWVYDVSTGYDIYFDKGNTDWESYCLYAWHENADLKHRGMGWPGFEMTDLGNGLYKIHIIDNNFTRIIFNNGKDSNDGGIQTDEMKGQAGKIYYISDQGIDITVSGSISQGSTSYTASSASYSRTCANQWGSLCLPFEFSAKQAGVTFYKMTNVELGENGFMTFTPIEGVISAGQPVAFKLDNVGDLSISNNDANGVSVVTIAGTFGPINDWYMKGTFTNTSASNIYIIQSNGIRYASSEFNLAPYRAWFTGNGNGAPLRISVDDTEGLQYVEQEDGTVKAFFDLQGRKLDSARKGLVIENGKIIMVK